MEIDYIHMYKKDVFGRNNCLQDKNRKLGDDATNLSQGNSYLSNELFIVE